MSTIFDLFYHEYCRARLTEMRKQFLVSVAGDQISKANWDAGDPVGPGGRDSGSGDGAAAKEAPIIR